MTSSKRGDVVPVGFAFSDDSGQKLRPAPVISSSGYTRGRNEVVDWKGAGLLFPSIATGILRTVARGVIYRKLGVMAKVDMNAVDNELRRFLAL